jgi:sulfur relay protein TusD/DsrE
VKVLVIVNESPWGSTLPATALRLVNTLLTGDIEVDSIFFRGDGVYNALQGRACDAGTPDLAAQWTTLSASTGFPLLICSSAASRRLDCAPGEGFREAGLPEVMERLLSCDRVLAF